MGCGQSSESTAIEPLGTDYKVKKNNNHLGILLGNSCITVFLGHIL